MLGESDGDSETKNESPISAAEMPQASSSPNTEPPQPQESVDHGNVENLGSHGMSKLMKNMKVRFKRINEDNWITGTLVSRAGKVTGKYPNAGNANACYISLACLPADVMKRSRELLVHVQGRLLENIQMLGMQMLVILLLLVLNPADVMKHLRDH